MVKQEIQEGKERRRRAAAWRRWTGESSARRRDLFTPRRGGARKGAGRRPMGTEAEVPHDLREPFEGRWPVHVTVRCMRGLPSLRRKGEYRELRRAFAKGAERGGFRLIEYVVMGDQMHLIVEGKDRRELARGLAGPFIRCARALKSALGAQGKGVRRSAPRSGAENGEGGQGRALLRAPERAQAWNLGRDDRWVFLRSLVRRMEGEDRDRRTRAEVLGASGDVAVARGMEALGMDRGEGSAACRRVGEHSLREAARSTARERWRELESEGRRARDMKERGAGSLSLPGLQVLASIFIRLGRPAPWW